MRRYETNDGKRFVAKDAADFVARLRADSHTPSIDDLAFMQEVARRINRTAGLSIRTESVGCFVDDLVRHGYVTTGAGNGEAKD